MVFIMQNCFPGPQLMFLVCCLFCLEISGYVPQRHKSDRKLKENVKEDMGSQRSESAISGIKDMITQLNHKLDALEGTSAMKFKQIKSLLRSTNQTKTMKHLEGRLSAIGQVILGNISEQYRSYSTHMPSSKDKPMEQNLTNLLQDVKTMMVDYTVHSCREQDNDFMRNETLSKIEEILVLVQEGLKSKDEAYLSKTKQVEEKLALMEKSGQMKMGQLENLLVKVVTSSFPCRTPAPDCLSHFYCGKFTDGEYSIAPAGHTPGSVYCDMETMGGGWTVIQRRVDGTVDFNRNYTQYQEGFGDPSGNFWIGLDRLHSLTWENEVQLYVYLETDDGKSAEAVYSQFTVTGPYDGYRVTVAGYSGTAGDAFSVHSGSRFTTWDRDQDEKQDYNCGDGWQSGWWFHSGCYHANLNGGYNSGNVEHGDLGIKWKYFTGYEYSLPHVHMMVRALHT